MIWYGMRGYDRIEYELMGLFGAPSDGKGF